MARPLTCLSFVAAATLIAAACSAAAAELSQEAVETAIATELQRDFGFDSSSVADMACDEFIPLPGDTETTIECVVGDPESDDRFELLVHFGVIVDSELDLLVEITTPIFDLVGAAAVAEQQLAADLGGNPRISCSRSLTVLVVGRRIQCRVVAEGGTAGPVDQAMVIEIIDDAGTFVVDLVP